MRLPVLLGALVALSGCFTSEPPPSEEGSSDDVPAGPTPASGGTPTPRAPAGATPTPVELRHDHAQEPRTVPFDLIAGNYEVSVEFTAPEGAPGCAGADVRVIVRDPEQNVLYEGAPGLAPSTPCTPAQGPDPKEADLAAGEWSVEFSGRGVIVSTLRVTPV